MDERGAYGAGPLSVDAGLGGSGAGTSAGGAQAGVSGGGGGSASAGEGFCGDGWRNGPGEQCDRGDLNAQSCQSLGFAVGVLSCDAACQFHLGSCGDTPNVCFDTALNFSGQLPCADWLCDCDPAAVENCDGACQAAMKCALVACGGPLSEGFSDCIGDSCDLMTFPAPFECVLQNQLDCSNPIFVTCGDNFRDDGEQCDGVDLAAADCQDFGYDGGQLACNLGCGFDVSACVNDTTAVCGDGRAEGDEDCDLADFSGRDCGSFGYSSGLLSCSGCQIDISSCTDCGNGRLDGFEACDGTNLDEESCYSLGYSSGILRCKTSCDFDLSACARCGNNSIEAGENCDSAQLAGQSCLSLGLADGALACHPSSCVYDTSNCGGSSSPVCGNGVAELGEQCDGADLLSNTCEALGYDEGELTCNAATCRLVTSQCTDVVGSCSGCQEEKCSAQLDACDMTCQDGLVCLSENCGSSPELPCVMGCFGGETERGLAAISMSACVVTNCGIQCGG
ncbi:MAG: hypothetical protein HRU17_00090 [Polyangiaceae bacterium]|nr:hypothetical protein [Polyangiaceae bacterium]